MRSIYRNNLYGVFDQDESYDRTGRTAVAECTRMKYRDTRALAPTVSKEDRI